MLSGKLRENPGIRRMPAVLRRILKQEWLASRFNVMERCSPLLDTQEVTDSSSVEPTTSFISLGAASRQSFGARPHECPHSREENALQYCRGPPSRKWLGITANTVSPLDESGGQQWSIVKTLRTESTVG